MISLRERTLPIVDLSSRLGQSIQPLPLSATEDALGDEVAAVGDKLILLIDSD